MNKKGMTLLELMVYMVVAALLLAPVVFLMHNSSLNMARSATNVDLRMSGRDVLNLMHEDIRNLGYKLDPDDLRFYGGPTYLNLAASAPVPPTPPTDTIGQRDSSSFISGDAIVGGTAGPFDSLTFIKGKLKATGEWDPNGVDTIRYVVRGDTLMREVVRLSGAIDDTKRRRLALNVAVLQFEYYIDPSDNPEDFFDEPPTTSAELNNKRDIAFIKVYLVLKDNKEIAAAPARADSIANYFFNPPNDRIIYERHEIMIPVPNNGLFPPCQPPLCVPK